VSENDGCAAFPHGDIEIGPNVAHWGERGMTLRDYFAAAALQGYLASFAGLEIGSPQVAGIAESAYDYADAMLAERSK